MTDYSRYDLGGSIEYTLLLNNGLLNFLFIEKVLAKNCEHLACHLIKSENLCPITATSADDLGLGMFRIVFIKYEIDALDGLFGVKNINNRLLKVLTEG